MTINIPDNISDEFLSLLDYAQTLFDEKDEAEFTDEEKKCFKFVRKLLDEKHNGRSYPAKKDEIKRCSECGTKVAGGFE